MTTYNTIRNELVALLQAVPDIGVVHNRDRWADNWPAFINLFTVTINGVNQVRGWSVTRSQVTPITANSHKGATYYQHQFVVKGLMGFNDAHDTDGTFQALVDRVIDQLNSTKVLGGAINVDYGTEPAQVTTIDLRMFGRVLCHYAEVQYTAAQHRAWA